MKTLFHHQSFLLFILVLSIAACSTQVETVVVENVPDAASASDTTQPNQAEMEDASFKHLRYGEISPIESLDPLFAQNTASQRAIQHIYDGLVGLNKNGSIIPAIAKGWEITSDSLSYRFTLRNDIFYHDSNVFVNGLGRRVLVSDILATFERMAEQNVPPEAAQLFMSIEGFEAYVKERRQIYLPQKRRVKSISGISAPTDSTIVFNLKKRDSDFLEKLASSYAVVYPQEAISDSGSQLHDNPVGSGPFQLSSIRGDSLYILNNNKEYSFTDVTLDRLDIIFEQDELALMRKMRDGEIDLIPELGPKMLQAFLGNNLNIKSTYPAAYQVYKGGNITYDISYVEQNNSELDYQETAGIIKQYDIQNFSNYINPTAMEIVPSNIYEQAKPTIYNGSITATFPNDAFINIFYQRLAGGLSNTRTTFTMLNTLVPNSDIQLHTKRSNVFNHQLDSSTLFQLNVRHVAISDGTIKNFGLNRYPWWLNLANVDIQPIAR